MRDFDRTVHATIPTDAGTTEEVVRYDRAGKWYLEGPDGRRRISITEAVDLCRTNPRARVHENMPGGTIFRARLRRP